MNNSRAGSNVRGSSDNLSIESHLSRLAIQTACDDVHQATDLVEARAKEQFRNVIGQDVSKRFADLMYEGVVESHDNASEMFKVVYTNGHSEEMGWEDLMKYLVPHEQPVHPSELPNKNNETGEGLAQIAPAPPIHKRGSTKKMSSGTQGKEGADNVCPPRQAGARRLKRSSRNDETSEMMRLKRPSRNDDTSEMMKLQHSSRNDETLEMMKLQHSTRNDDETSEMMKLRHSARNDETSEILKLWHSARNDETSGMMKLRRSTRKKETLETMKLRRSTRKRKQVVYSYCEETTDEDEDEDDLPNYPLPPIIQVPWADGGDENSEGLATRGRCAPQDRRKNGLAKRHWVSLRISASSYPGDGHKIASDESEG